MLTNFLIFGVSLKTCRDSITSFKVDICPPPGITLADFMTKSQCGLPRRRAGKPPPHPSAPRGRAALRPSFSNATISLEVKVNEKN
jgi:hypothetical protein